QKGRYREFYQCDVDVIGSRSQVNELELVQMVDAVFSRLGVRVGIHINNRKVLTGFAEIAGAPDKVVDITVAIDKLDKIGLEKVKEEMAEKEISAQGIAVIEQILSLSGGFQEKLAAMQALFQGGSASGIQSPTGLKGLEELEELFGLIAAAGVSAPVEMDLSLARGLNYYTGAIFEVKALDWEIGSICGGGRYDNLTGIFGLPDLSGVGISFGADRIYDVLVGLDLFPAALESSTQLLFAVMGADELRYVLPVARALREAGVAVEVYPEATKLKKQFDYADKKSIPFISINGSTEMEAGTLNIKNLRTGDQKAFPVADRTAILEFLK
ncbi:MAG: ATP phosphoribosyltransferase regulatory subunit, partial [Bacteroidales bacterium]|nr:ATP phosphoribosyltransferase regulatory subunit [Bacteroidales bacterium]